VDFRIGVMSIGAGEAPWARLAITQRDDRLGAIEVIAAWPQGKLVYFNSKTQALRLQAAGVGANDKPEVHLVGAEAASSLPAFDLASPAGAAVLIGEQLKLEVDAIEVDRAQVTYWADARMDRKHVAGKALQSRALKAGDAVAINATSKLVLVQLLPASNLHNAVLLWQLSRDH
jgi:hypothetical protein